MRKYKDGVVLLYVLFLLGIGLILGLIASNNFYIYNNNLEAQKLGTELRNNIYSKSDIIFKLAGIYNSDGDGYIDNISCPQNVFMSGATSSGYFDTSLSYLSGSFFCNGLYGGYDVDLFLSETYDDFITATYVGDSVPLGGGVGDRAFSGTNSDDSLISNITTGTPNFDNIDDNFNSDNYMITSTGSDYFWGCDYEDNDVYHRKNILGYFGPSDYYTSIFFNNDDSNQIVEDNTNNDDLCNLKIGDITNGLMKLKLGLSVDFKLVEFDKDLYNTENTLVAKQSYNGYSLSGEGYISLSGSLVFLQENKSGEEFDFDFKNNYYAIFLKNPSSSYISYSLSAETDSGTGIFLTPIDDSKNIMEYLGSDIIIDDGKYVRDQFIVKRSK